MSQRAAKVMLVVWLILLLPWTFVALDSLFIVQSDHSLKTHIFLSSVWSYPIAVAIAAILRKKAPLIALLPCVPFAMLFTSVWWW